MIIKAIDPGEKYIGVISYNTEYKKIETLQILNTELEKLYKFLNPEPEVENIFIIEKFILYSNKAKYQFYKESQTTLLIGNIEQYLSHFNNVKIIKQTAAQAKIWNNERLVRLGFLEYKNHKYYINEKNINRHVRDALKHLIYYVNKNLFNNRINKQLFVG